MAKIRMGTPAVLTQAARLREGSFMGLPYRNVLCRAFCNSAGNSGMCSRVCSFIRGSNTSVRRIPRGHFAMQA